MNDEEKLRRQIKIGTIIGAVLIAVSLILLLKGFAMAVLQ